MFNFMLAFAIITTVVAVAVFGTFRERPGAPLFSSSSQIEDDKPSLLVQLKSCASNKAFIFTALGTSGVILHLFVFTMLIG